MGKCWRLELDYDLMQREQVEQDAKRLSNEFPQLGDYTLEPSKSGDGDHWHVNFPKSMFQSFQEAFDIAEKSLADPDWLDLCKDYECFGLETEGSRSINEARQQKEKQRVVNKPTRMITSPVILDLIPASALDARRIFKMCEAIKDATWQYTSFIDVWTLKQHVQIGCVNEAQATRRMKWLSDQTLNFTATIKKNALQQ